MSFKRMEGFAGSIPQKFADTKIPKCPMCGTTDPHWSLDERRGKLMSFDPEENANKYESSVAWVGDSTPLITNNN